VTFTGGHQCVVEGINGTNEAVDCGEFAWTPLSVDEVDVWGLGQTFCQTGAGANLQCAGIHQNVALLRLNANGTRTQVAGQRYSCGQLGGVACPKTTRFTNESGHFRTLVPAGGCLRFVTALLHDQVVLPGGVSIVPTGEWDSAILNIGSNCG